MSLILPLAIGGLLFLLVLHEAGHFLVAKAFGIEVKEFGIGYPPRVWGKKVGETLYSLNLVPFGAFVDIPKEALRSKRLPKGLLVLAAGVISFWLFAFFLLAFSLMRGAPTEIGDRVRTEEAWVRVSRVAPDSPAEKAGIQPGDILLDIGGEKGIAKKGEAQNLIARKEGEKVELELKRGGEKLSFEVLSRTDPPKGEGAIGVFLSRVAIRKWSPARALPQAMKETLFLTYLLVREVGRAVVGLFTSVESRLEPSGPVGIMKVFVERGKRGPSHFLQTMALVSINLAVLNSLPFLPITDGGRMVFLALAKARKKPFNEKLEERINTFFFLLLIGLMIFVTIKDLQTL